MNSERKHASVVYSTDESYWVPLYVSLQSLLENNLRYKFTVYIVCSAVDPIFVKHAEQLRRSFSVDLNYVSIDPTVVASFPLFGGLPGAVYYRLFVGSVLPRSLKRVLYLDCDTLVLNPLGGLIDCDLGGAIVGAVDDAVADVGKRLGVMPYFNSGILLIDLKLWREARIEESALQFLEEQPERIFCPDQDVLNVVLAGRWKQLPIEFNFQTGHCDNLPRGRPDEDPLLVHYVADKKPWLYRTEHPFKSEFRRVLARTPYASFREPDVRRLSLRNLIRWVKQYRLSVSN